MDYKTHADNLGKVSTSFSSDNKAWDKVPGHCADNCAALLCCFFLLSGSQVRGGYVCIIFHLKQKGMVETVQKKYVIKSRPHII